MGKSSGGIRNPRFSTDGKTGPFKQKPNSGNAAYFARVEINANLQRNETRLLFEKRMGYGNRS